MLSGTRWLIILLALSSGINAAFWWNQRSTTTIALPQGSNASPSAAAPAQSIQDAWKFLHKTDPAELAKTLRQAGAPESFVRSLILAAIDDIYSPRDQSLRSASAKHPRKTWWEADPRPSVETQLALLELQRAKLDLQQALLGPMDEPNDGLFSNLAPEKRVRVRLISSSYEAMIATLRGSQIYLMPSEREKIKQLGTQRDNELLAMLTPDELAEYKIRTSRTTASLRSRWGDFDLTEDEFKAVYAIKKAVDDTGRLSPDDERRMAEQYKAALGESRGTAVIRILDFSYRDLRQMLVNINLPVETADRVYDLRDAMASESRQIAAKAGLSAGERQAAFQALAIKTRSSFSDLLGPTVGPAYLKQSEMWLNHVESGHSVSFVGSSAQLE